MKKLVLQGRTTTYHVDGPVSPADPDGSVVKTVVLLHGFPLNARIWHDVAQLLAADYRVICPNLRGFGPFVADEDFTIEELAGDVRALLIELDALPCVMVGLSMGGYVAQSFADQWADDLLGLGLVNTRSAADGEAAKAARVATANLANARGTAAVVDGMHPKMLAHDTYRNAPGCSESLLRLMLDTPAPTIGRASRAMGDRKDYSGVLKGLRIPVAVVAGQEDQIVQLAEAQAVADQPKLGTLSILEGVGHMSPIEDPSAVAAIIRELVQSAYGPSQN